MYARHGFDRLLARAIHHQGAVIMSTEENKSILRRYFEEAWNRGQLDVLDEIVAAHYVNHDPAVPGLPPGPDGLKAIMAGFRAAFPDLHFSIEDSIAEGDKVATRWIMRGTQA